MIDVKLLREDPELFLNSCRARGYGSDLVESFFELDKKWREITSILNRTKHDKNVLSLEISKAVKEKKDPLALKEQVRVLNAKIDEMEREVTSIESERDQKLRLIPNIIDPEVRTCKGDDNNPFVKFNGNASVFHDDIGEFMSRTENKGVYTEIDYRPLSHVDLQANLDLVDLERAGKISGARFYFIKNRLFKLELALMNYAVDFLSQRGFSVVEPPLMLNYDSMARATDIETFKESLYKIEGEDLYLIATSEHPIAAMLRDEILEQKELPLRVCGVSPCFRKEAGAHGKDTKGIFRVHNFNKVEQFIFCEPEYSKDFHNELLANTEEIYQSLGLSYRVIDFCSAELSVLNARKFDIEVWFPSQGKFREVASASNNTDYQSRSLNIRYRSKDGNKFVHTLNNTALATTRTLVAIMENFQDRSGKRITVPDVLVPYTGFDTIEK